VDWQNQDFDLQSSSPAKAIGKKFGAPIDPPGLPAGVVPDAGAYQSGLADWAYVEEREVGRGWRKGEGRGRRGNNKLI
jgi:hypothetical protein